MNELFKVGDAVRIVNDWMDGQDKGKRAVITGFQTNNRTQFARVRWTGQRSKDLTLNCGILFPLDELRKL